jgi:hypothetical protein
MRSPDVFPGSHEPPEQLVLTLADLQAARLELAAALLTPLLQATPALPGPVRSRLAPLRAQLEKLALVVRRPSA